MLPHAVDTLSCRLSPHLLHKKCTESDYRHIPDALCGANDGPRERRRREDIGWSACEVTNGAWRRSFLPGAYRICRHSFSIRLENRPRMCCADDLQEQLGCHPSTIGRKDMEAASELNAKGHSRRGNQNVLDWSESTDRAETVNMLLCLAGLENYLDNSGPWQHYN